jgi:hypothetical protein
MPVLHSPPYLSCWSSPHNYKYFYYASVDCHVYIFELYCLFLHCVYKSPVLFPMRSLDSSSDLILPAALYTWVRLGLQQKCVPETFLGVKRGRHIGLTASEPTVSRLSRKCGSIYVYQSYRPTRPATGTASSVFITCRQSNIFVVQLLVPCCFSIHKLAANESVGLKIVFNFSSMFPDIFGPG